MKKISILSLSILFILLTMICCDKTGMECEDNNTGSIRVKNNSSFTLNITIDGSNIGAISPGNNTIKDGISVGNHTVSAYGNGVIYGDTDVYVIQCQENSVTLN